MACRHCGFCCNQIPVNLTIGDIYRICDHLKIELEEFFEKYGGLKLFVDPKNPEMHDIDLGLELPCKFWDGKCKIYPARPLNCCLFPYWILADAPDEKIPELLKKSKFRYDLKNKEQYKNYKEKIGNIILEEAKWFELNQQIKKGEKVVMKVPIEEVKQAIKHHLNKIKENTKKI